MTDEPLEAAVNAFHDRYGSWIDAVAVYPAIEAAIEAHEKSLAKVGLGIRPREPTEEMLGEGEPNDRLGTMCTQIWQAMWDAYKPDG